VNGVGTQIALTYVLTIEDPHRFRVYLWLCPEFLRPGRNPRKHQSARRGRPLRYVRTLLAQGAPNMLGPFGEDRDLRRWGLKLAERVGKNAKKRAVVAARKLAILLHRFWASGEVYEPCEIAIAR
jgi:hypothetical protein